MVSTRNIFDPDRQPIRPASERRPQAPPPTRNDSASLTGIMVTAEKTLAFFSGTRPDLNKVLPVQGTIAGATVTRIAPNEVEIEREGKKTVLAIGQPLPLGAGAAPAAPAATAGAGTTEPSSPALESGAPATITPTTPAAPGSTEQAAPSPEPPISNRDDLIKRMMERRQRETK